MIPFVFEERPDDLKVTLEVAAIYVIVKGQLLIMQLSAKKAESGFWGVPAGKIDKGESPLISAQRELFEETQLSVQLENIQEMAPLYIRKPEMDYIYYPFIVSCFDVFPEIVMSDEHTALGWFSYKEASLLPLMKGAKEALIIVKDKLTALQPADQLFPTTP